MDTPGSLAGGRGWLRVENREQHDGFPGRKLLTLDWKWIHALTVGSAVSAEEQTRLHYYTVLLLLGIPAMLVIAFFLFGKKEGLFWSGLLLACSLLLLKHVLTEERIPQRISESMLAAGLGRISLLIAVNMRLLIGGQFMEPSGLLMVVAPLVFPIALALDIVPIHPGIMRVLNMETGMRTAAVGLSLFVTAGVAGRSMMAVIRAATPWLGVMFLFLIIVSYVAWVSTWLPTLLMGPEIIALNGAAGDTRS